MDGTSVLNYPSYNILYPDSAMIDTFEWIGTKRIESYLDQNGNPTNLTVGATNSLNLEGVNELALFFAAENAGVNVYSSTYSNSIRNDSNILNIQNTAPWTYVSAGSSSNGLILSGTDIWNTTVLGLLETAGTSNNYCLMDTPVRNGFLMSNFLRVQKDVVIDGILTVNNLMLDGSLNVASNLVSHGHVFGIDLNVWKDSAYVDASNATRVGYSLRINDQDQLEFLKVSQFTDCNTMSNIDIVKRIALFGYNKLTPNDTNEIDNYIVFDEIQGVAIASSSNNSIGLPLWNTTPLGAIYTQSPLGLNVSNPQHALDIIGTASADVVIAGTVSTTSDARLKQIVENTNPNYLELINQLNVVKFRFLADSNNKVQTGLIAQEVEEVVADAISISKFGNLDDCRLINNNVLLAYMIGAIQEISSKLNSKKIL